MAFVGSLPGRRPAPSQPARLDELFLELRRPNPPRPPHQIEDLIWAAWASHPVATIAERLALANSALGRGEYRRAEKLLNPLIASYPDWSEVWNKRATLYYLEERDAESFADIRRTLELEPRHFGALCGLGQVCLRRGLETEALLAFDAALTVNPHLSGVRAVVEELRTPDDGLLH